MKLPTEAHDRDNLRSTIKVNTESKEDRELNAFLSVVGTEVPPAIDFDCDCDSCCDFEFDDDDFL